LAFGVAIDKDIVRRLLNVHYRPDSLQSIPVRIGNPENALGSGCDGPVYASPHGFGVHNGSVGGLVLCRMFHRAIRGHRLPRNLSSDYDPPYRFHQWQANLQVLEVTDIKTVPYDDPSRDLAGLQSARRHGKRRGYRDFRPVHEAGHLIDVALVAPISAFISPPCIRGRYPQTFWTIRFAVA